MASNQLNIQQLQESVLKSKNDVKVYKSLYFQEKKGNTPVIKQFKLLQDENRKLMKQKTVMANKLSRSEEELLKFKPSKHYKAYNKLTSYSMRRKRSLECRNILSNVFSHLKDVKKARVTLTLCQESANFIWSEREIAYLHKSNNQQFTNEPNGIADEELREDSQGQVDSDFDTINISPNSNNNPNSSTVEGNQSRTDQVGDEESDYNYVDDEPDADPDPNKKEIFDEEGNWNKIFLRKIIHVMDKYKISHDAFHELRMVSIGYLPLINRIKAEKCKMSTEVNYTVDESVRF